MSTARIVTRRFPDYGWCWPRGDLDLLLKAVMQQDDDTALAAGFEWLDTHNIDDIEFREQRLLTALSERFGKRLSPSPAHPRLVGLQRLLWTKSRMTMRDSSEALSALSDAGIAMMLMKGASRVAVNAAAQRGRVAHDIDILVRPADMPGAFGVLLDRGWQAASGAGPLRLKSGAQNHRAMNFFKGEFGDIDVHQMAYQPPHAHEEDEAGLWSRSTEAEFDGHRVRVPAASDRIALAIAHGSLDAHTHSDWLVDIDSIVRSETIDWSALIESLQRRGIVIPAAAALSYLAREIGTPMPRPVLEELLSAADGRGWTGRISLLECKPRTDFTFAIAAARGIAKQIRIWRGNRLVKTAREPIHRARIARTIGKGQAEPPASQAKIRRERDTAAPVVITLRVDMPKARRRMDWELTTADRHICVLRYRKLSIYSGSRDLTFRIPADLLGESDEPLFVTARPSRFLRANTDPKELEKQGPVAFAIVQ